MRRKTTPAQESAPGAGLRVKDPRLRKKLGLEGLSREEQAALVNNKIRSARGLELLRGGKTSAEVAAELGVSVQSVNNWARSAGISRPRGAPRGKKQKTREPYRPRTSPRSSVLPIIDLLLQDHQPAEIAASLGISRQAVHAAKRWLSDD